MNEALSSLVAAEIPAVKQTGGSAASRCERRFGNIDRRQAAQILRAARHATAPVRDELTQQAMAMLPDSRPALRLHIRSLLEDHDFEHAHALIARGLLVSPSDVLLMQYRATALDGLGRRDEALEEIRHLLRIQPQRVGALVIGGRIAMAAGQHERAVMWLTRAHLCRPMCEQIRRQLAEALVLSHQADAALEIINSLPRPLPLLRAKALRTLGRLRDAADVLNAAMAGSQQNDDALDELLTESLIVAELRGDNDEIARLLGLMNHDTPWATLQAARINLRCGDFRLALRLAASLTHDDEIGAPSLAIIITAAGMLQRNRLATRALRRLRERYGRTPAPVMYECWRRAMVGSIINDQRNPHGACADPTSSLLQPLLRQSAMVLKRRLRRHSTAEAGCDIEEIRRQYELCRNTLMLRSRILARSHSA